MKNIIYFLVLIFFFQSCNYFLNYIEKTKSFYFENSNELNRLSEDLSHFNSSFIIGFYNPNEFEIIFPLEEKNIFSLNDLNDIKANSNLSNLLVKYQIDIHSLKNVCERIKQLRLRYVKVNNKNLINFSTFPDVGLEYNKNMPMNDFNKERFIAPNWFYYIE